MDSFRWLSTNLLLLAYWTPLINALYYIDNTNAMIQYRPSAGNNTWHVSNLLTDYSRCYSDTAIYNMCMTGDGCHITIPFTGTGIAIQIVQLGPRNNSAGLATNVSITLDANPPTIKTLYPIGAIQYNVTLYDIDGLVFGDHTLDIALVSMIYPGRTFLYGTEMMFDYAVVNNTSPPSASTVASSPIMSASRVSPSTTSSSTDVPLTVSQKTPVNTGAIAGGVVGGLLGVLVITSLLLRWRRRRGEEVDSESKVHPFNTTSHTYDEGSEPLPRTSSIVSSFSTIPDAHHIRAPVGDSQYSTPDTKGSIRQVFARSITPTQSLHRLSSTLAAIRPDFTVSNSNVSSPTAPSVAAQSLKRGRFRTNSLLWEASGPPERSRPSSATVTPIEPTPLPAELGSSLMDLPDEQIEFIRGLVRVNVPIEEIVRVVDVMKEDRGDGSSSAVVGETTSMLNPAVRTLYRDT